MPERHAEIIDARWTDNGNVLTWLCPACGFVVVRPAQVRWITCPLCKNQWDALKEKARET